MKGDNLVAFCARHCNVIAPLVTALGNRHESPLLSEALSNVTLIAQTVGLELSDPTGSWDFADDSRGNRKAIVNRGMTLPFRTIGAEERLLSVDASVCSQQRSIGRGFSPSTLPGKTNLGVYCCASNGAAGCTMH